MGGGSGCGQQVGTDEVWKCTWLLGFCGVAFPNLLLCLGTIS